MCSKRTFDRLEAQGFVVPSAVFKEDISRLNAAGDSALRHYKSLREISSRRIMASGADPDAWPQP